MSTSSLLTDMGCIDIALAASADLSAYQFYAVKVDTSNQVAAAGANEKCLGILQNTPSAALETAIVRIQGISKAKINETGGITFGQFLTPTATADLEVCDAAGEEYIGKALGAYADNDMAEILVIHGEVEATDA